MILKAQPNHTCIAHEKANTFMRSFKTENEEYSYSILCQYIPSDLV